MLVFLPALANPLPATLPTYVVEGSDGLVYVGRRGRVVSRSLSDGSVVDVGPIGGELADGWTVDGARVLRSGVLVTTLKSEPIAVAATPDVLWVLLRRGLVRVRSNGSHRQVARGRGSTVVPVGAGVAVEFGKGFTRFDARGRLTCRAQVRLDAITSGPGDELVVVGRDGLSVWNAECVQVGETKVEGHLVGLLDKGRLAVVDRELTVRVVAWPSLQVVQETPPVVDETWRFAQGPAGPVLRKGAHTFDPQTGAYSTAAPEPALIVDLESYRTPDGGRLRLASGDSRSRFAVHAAAGPAQVFEVASLRAVGPALPAWFKQASLSPDGRLLVGIVGVEACAFEVATGRRLWAVPVDRLDQVLVHETFVELRRDGHVRLLDPGDGADLWVVESERSTFRRRFDALVIHAGTVTWRSDGAVGVAAQLPWTGAAPELETPALGDVVAVAP